ncbi:protein tfg-1-like isoform X2 [Phaenicophaeus curvirostris]|uniref:protein tfg-1-like isoform X2 n=1 Tax=Phaenicophaeus curvirostris TaxID=33595 RepID=UPI0037F0D75A
MLEALVEGGAEGLVLIRDNAACEGRSLLRAFACAAARRQEPVQLLLLEAPRAQFEAGLSPDITRWFQVLEGFPDPLGWGGGPPIDVGGAAGGVSAPQKSLQAASAGFAELAPPSPAPPSNWGGPEGPAGGGAPQKRLKPSPPSPMGPWAPPRFWGPPPAPPPLLEDLGVPAPPPPPPSPSACASHLRNEPPGRLRPPRTCTGHHRCSSPCPPPKTKTLMMTWTCDPPPHLT